MSDALRILAVFGLVGANAFFVMGEYAVVTARRGRIQARIEAGNRRAETVLRLMDDPVRVISTVQVGITAIGILTGAIGEPLIRDVLGDGLPTWAGFAIAFLTVTYLSVVFGELVPKALTLEHAEAVAVLVAPPIDLFGKVSRPLVWVLQGSGALVLRPFGIRDITVSDMVNTPEELRGIVDEAEQAGAIPRAQEELLYRVLEFAGREARDVMVPAAEIVWLDGGLSAEAAVERLRDTTHRRFPVGDGSIDRLLGAVHAHEILGAAATDGATRRGASRSFDQRGAGLLP